jgi:undecaprenyl-diphosphatase
MGVLQALILGIIQGLTEFLPISSSGHVELGSVLLNVQNSENLLFITLIHAATSLSTIIIYRKDITGILKGMADFRLNESWDFIFKIMLSAVPVAILGLLFLEEVESLFGGKTGLIGVMLIITSVLLGFTYFVRKNEGEVTYMKSLIIGIAQAIAVFPGLSRSGSTIATGLLLGVDKTKITRFSFLMVILPVLGVSFLDILKLANNPSDISEIPVAALIAGTFAAFATGIVACRWMIKIVRNGKLIYFAIYCFLAGTVAILTTLF